MKASTARWIAWSAVGLTALLSGASVDLVARSGPPTGVFDLPSTTSLTAQISFSLAILVFPVVGAVIVSRRPTHPIGWLFCADGVLVAYSMFAGIYAFHALDTNPGSLPGGAVLEVTADGLWLPTIAVTTVFLFLLFPSGRLNTRGERVTAWIGGIAAVIGGPIAAMTEEWIYPAYGRVANPLPTRMPDVVFNATASIGFFVLLGCLIASVVLLIRRYRRSRGEERQQLKWFLFAASMVVITTIPTNIVDNPQLVFEIVNLVALLMLPVVVAIAILKYHLWDLDVVIKKTVVFAVMVLGLMAFATLVAIIITSQVDIGFLYDNPPLFLVAGIALGLLAIPLYRLSRRIADRVVYGGRATPYEVMTDFASRLAGSYASDDVLPRTAAVLGQGTGASHVTIHVLVGGKPVQAASWPSADVLAAEQSFEVRHQGELLGSIGVAMPASDPMNPAKERLITHLADQAGLVLRNVRLIEELRASRRRIVTAQDERAKQLERNIHDGAQQQLVALAVKLRLAEQAVDRDAGAAKELLASLHADADDALENLRDLARGIFPPLLADKGLAAALEAQARRAAVPITIEADGIGRFPQEVESAVYFSCLEALQNVAKYAEATRATIVLTESDGSLRFTVTDDGKGFDPSSTGYGTGLQGIEDRLDAIGGSLEVTSAPGQGTSVVGTVLVS
jgi:signal transduction histidine kinase